MPIEMNCPSCASRFRFAAEHAGKSARCQKCGVSFIIAAPPAEEVVLTPELVAGPPVAPTALTAVPPKAPVPPIEAVDDPKPGKRASKPPRLSDEDDVRRPRRDRPCKPAPSSAPWIVAAFVGFVVFVGVAASCAVFALRRADDRMVEVPPIDIRQEEPPRWDDQKIDPGLDPGLDPGPGPKNWPPEMKKEEPKRAPQELPIAVAFTEGKFETNVAFNAEQQPDQPRLSKEYRFNAKADTAYWIIAPETTRAELRAVGPDGPVGRRDDQFGGGKQIVFLAAKAATHSVFVECFRFDAQPFKLTIKEMNGSEPLPNHLKLVSDNKDLPTLAKAIKLNVYDKQFTSAAFSPDNKIFWIAHNDATLSRWENPGFERKGAYKAPGLRLYALCIDGQGRLYAQKGKSDRLPVSIVNREIGDIDVYENLDPTSEAAALPAPARRIPLAGIVKRMLHSSDGRWIYGLDTHNRRLFRIDTEKREIDREVKNISTSTKSFCLTPDGKKIYCCSETNRIDIVDVAEFKLTRSVAIDKGQPVDIGATNEGIVFLAGSPSGQPFGGGGNAYLVDLTGQPAERAVAMAFDMRVGNGTVGSSFVCMLPDQRAVFISGDRAVVAVDIPARPALFHLNVRERFREDYFVPGQMVLSPDGRTLLYDTGTILSVSR
jgi:hypothetical protein